MSLAAAGFDFHCHVDLLPNPAAAIAACERDAIFALAVTTTPKAWSQNRQWTARSTYVHSAVGLHPELAGERRHEIPLLESYMRDTAFVGEIGLDGTRQHRKHWEAQIEVFTRALECAERLGRRVVSIHSRRAERDVLAILQVRTTPARVLPVLHWFSGSLAEARKAVEIGCYFSVNHRTLCHATGASILRSLPVDRLLTETDAPFALLDDRQTEPNDVKDTSRKLGETLGISASAMSETLTTNASRVLAFAGIDGLL